jgi:hypothetical protein
MNIKLKTIIEGEGGGGGGCDNNPTTLIRWN